MSEPRVIAWVSAGAASAIAAKLALREYGDRVIFAYCETNAEHPDNERFLGDLTRWLNGPIVRLRSEKYHDTWGVWEDRSYLAGIDGAPCSGELKMRPAEAFRLPDDVEVFGYTADAADQKRASRLRMNWPKRTIVTPLIDGGLMKAHCLAMLENAGIALPALYGLGFPNNNCIPCVKATSPNYWSLVRKQFPVEFERIAKLSRELDVRLTRIKDERRFVDEIPADWPTLDPVVPSCDFLCGLAEMGLAS